MRAPFTLIFGAAVGFIAFGASAAERTVTLTVKSMTCGTCPYLVKKALDTVPGVLKTEVSLEKKQAWVSYDDTKASVEDLRKATGHAGYPAQVIPAGNEHD
jgi:mercuric ion binding protein